MAECRNCNKLIDDGSEFCDACKQQIQLVENYFGGIQRNLAVIEKFGYHVEMELRRLENSVLYIASNSNNEKCVLQKYTIPGINGNTVPVEEQVQKLISELSNINENQDNQFVITYYDYDMERSASGDEEIYYLYIRMNYFTSLLQQYNKPGMKLCDLLKVGIDICEALEGCHKNNRIHNNLNLSSIYLNQKGRYVLGDFVLFGTNSNKEQCFVAPEVLAGDKCSPASDIYSLGMILYVLLNDGKLPDMPEERSKKKTVDLDFPYWVNHRLKEVICKATAPCKKRYKNVESMRKDLENLLENMPQSRLNRILRETVPENAEVQMPPIPTNTVLPFHENGRLPVSDDALENEGEKSSEMTVPKADEKVKSNIKLREILRKNNLRDIVVLIGVILVIVAALGAGTRYLYNSGNYEIRSLIEDRSYALAYQEIVEMKDNGRNVDDIVKTFIDACMTEHQYKRVAMALELFSAEGYSDAIYFEGIITKVIETGNNVEVEAIYNALYDVESLRPMLDGLRFEN